MKVLPLQHETSPEMTVVISLLLPPLHISGHDAFIRAAAAVRSGGGSCDGASAAPSVCPAGARTSVGLPAQLRPGSHTPWKAGPGSALAFFRHSGRPERMPGLQNGREKQGWVGNRKLGSGF